MASKGVDVLLEGYTAYRPSVADPWSLTCCGRGALGPRVAATEGVTDLGFVQPENQPAVLRDHGAFILPSLYEPWGVVLAEALAAGLPAVCTTAVGAGVELLHPHSNGWLVPPGDPRAIAATLRRIHEQADELPAMGRRAAAVAPGYAATVWARRVEAICHGVASHTPSSP